MKNTIKSILFASLVGVSVSVAVAEVKFMPAKTGTGDPNSYEKKPDYAILEATMPLTKEDRKLITVDKLKQMNQEQLDQIYARLESGPIPAADFRGTLLIRNELVLTAEEKILEGVKNKGFIGKMGLLATNLLCRGRDRLECLGQFLWSGKRFYQPNEFGQIQLRNAVNPIIKGKIAQLAMKQAGLNKLSEPLSRAPKQDFDGSSKLMLFPANVFCGLSLIDTRHESIIVDYAYGDDFSPYIPEIDGLVGRDGSWIRDEIRMIRPGLYLGRAYMDRMFLLNFVLESKSLAAQESNPEAWKNKCWTGDSWQ